MVKNLENQMLISSIEGNLEHRERYLSEPDDWIRASDYIADVRIREAERYANIWFFWFCSACFASFGIALLILKYLIK